MTATETETEAEQATEPAVPPANELEDPLTVDYGAVHPDTSKTYGEYNYAERRAVLLKRIERAGHPKAMPHTYSELADEFDVSKSTIHRDLRVLAEWTAENVERDHIHIMDSVFRGAILDLVDEGKNAWAAEVGKEWFEWLADMGAIERVPAQVDLDATVRHEGDETEEYVVVPSEDESGTKSASSRSLPPAENGGENAATSNSPDAPVDAPAGEAADDENEVSE
jgi:hypothetical protein